MSVFTQFNNCKNYNALLFGTDNYVGLKDLLKISIEDFHRDYFDIDTCNQQGLENWGRILDISDSYQIPDYKGSFGFGDVMGLPEPPEYPQNFDHGAFWEGKLKLSQFSTEEYRQVLKLKYRILTSNFSYADITDIMNLFVKSIDKDYKFKLNLIQPMVLEYQFNFSLNESTSLFYYAITEGYILPVPLGVRFTVAFLQPF